MITDKDILRELAIEIIAWENIVTFLTTGIPTMKYPKTAIKKGGLINEEGTQSQLRD